MVMYFEFSCNIAIFRLLAKPMMRPATIIALLVFLLPGCSIQQLAIRSLDGMFDNTLSALMQEQDLQIAEPAIASNLKLLDGLVRTDPENGRLLLMACQGYTSYALAFTGDSLQRALLFYHRAQAYGRTALGLRGIPDSAFSSGPGAMHDALRKLGKEDVPLVFWTGNAWGNAVNLQRDDPGAIASMPTVNAMMEWVLEQDSTYYYGGPLLYFGVYYASLPAILGGKPELGRSYFERAASVSGGKFLMTSVYEAQTYAVQVQNDSLYTDLLTRVIQAPVDLLPEQNLANAVAKARAKILLARKADFF